ncbi:hypothetical protein Cs7R123_56580 [Catellatospora sp. TT07R-123]|uniref:DUF6348 family protein n=1 Tax=Catellatospora sp. TT07R-123 TaxID=2733863 RepID=UPI001B196D40|nr:DUF6348 family protein [Catellatospora sp. TT07R-123]GHJ48316.1 hypothetical protein Cs7R123_56580 [Catellatospora sp. TT07R-123]
MTYDRNREVLTIVAERLSRFGPAWSADDIDGPLLRGPGTVGVLLQDNHTDHDNHLDLVLLLNVDRPADTSIVDCTSGLGADLRDQWRQAVDSWAELTAATAIELMQPANKWADHLHGDNPNGVLGWHAILPGYYGFGVGPVGELPQWAADTPLLPLLAPHLEAEADREFLNGVKILFGGPAGRETAEVRVNGRVAEAASEALLALPWPRPQRPAYTKTFVLMVHRETTACGG